MNKKTIIYTDGACRGNPGVGGWGVYIQRGEDSEVAYGSTEHTTNNRMELVGAIEALKRVQSSEEVQLCTDSKYVRDGVISWMPKWKLNNWRTASKSAVKNKDLWVELDGLMLGKLIEWKWVKGHDGNAGNEEADRLANYAIDQARK